MATSSYKTFLMEYLNNAWAKLVDIKSFPDLFGDPELLETTTLSDGVQTFILGIQSQDALSCTANYTPEDFAKIRSRKGVRKYAIWFGGTEDASGVVTPTGVDGKFEFNGEISASIPSKGVNEVRDMNITLAPSSVITVATESVLQSVTLDKTTVAANDSATVTADGFHYNLEPEEAPSLTYLWQIRSKNGTTWTDLTASYTGYNTATLTVKAADAEKHYRCKVIASGSATGTVYSEECTVNAA